MSRLIGPMFGHLDYLGCFVKLGEMLLLRFGCPAGLLWLCIAMIRYRAETNAVIFDRYSRSYFLLLLFVGLLTLFAFRRSLRTSSPSIGIAQGLREIACFCWGLAVLLESIQEPKSVAAIFMGDLFGSLYCVSAGLKWVCLCALCGMVLSYAYSRWDRRLLASISSLLIVLLLAEAAVRFVAFLFPIPQGYPTNRTLVWYGRYSPEAFSRESFRGSGRERCAEGREPIFLLLGDSYAFGTGIQKLEGRFGEQVAWRLNELTGSRVCLVTLAQPDTHTLQHRQFWEQGKSLKPGLVMLLYVFNDIDYLSSMTPRDVISEYPQTLMARLHPLRLLFKNFFAFQELFLRLRVLGYFSAPLLPDPYDDPALVDRHLSDLRGLAQEVEKTGAHFVLVPYDLGILLEPGTLQRYRTFIQKATVRGISVISLEDALKGAAFSAMVVSKFDSHPNELAHERVAPSVARALAAQLGAIESRSAQAPASAGD